MRRPNGSTKEVAGAADDDRVGMGSKGMSKGVMVNAGLGLIDGHPARNVKRHRSLERRNARDKLAFYGNSAPGLAPGEDTMLGWALVFLIVALIAGYLGFVAMAGLAATIAKILFIIFIVLLIVSFISRALRGGSVV